MPSGFMFIPMPRTTAESLPPAVVTPSASIPESLRPETYISFTHFTLQSSGETSSTERQTATAACVVIFRASAAPLTGMA